MNLREKIAFILYFANSIVNLIFGLKYLFCDTFMSYHREAVGMEWAELGPGLQILINGLIKMTASAFIIVGISSIILLLIPFRKGEYWVKWLIPFIQIGFLGFSLYVTLKIALNTQASTPWPFTIVGLVVGIIAFLISGFYRRPKEHV